MSNSRKMGRFGPKRQCVKRPSSAHRFDDRTQIRFRETWQ
ncbi:hypothetical protein DP42_4250 [Burkholderia pseudomallei]|nr:hypothetical protein DP42_4250 [Burkholderia pseudomallei]